MRKVAQWFALRTGSYIGLRLIALVLRYGITQSRATKRTIACMEMLARFDCKPTLFAPGQVVDWNGAFCRRLQRLGAELGVHGYHHMDFRALRADESRHEFARAAAAYQRMGITFEGFRCPYLSYTPQLNDVLPEGRLEYSSNKAIWWDVVSTESELGGGNGGRAIFDGLSRFYQPLPSTAHIAVPELSGPLVEIPVCLPDDLQLLDGLKLGERGMQRAWLDVLHHTHRRGELFNLMFHPESYDQCAPALEAVVREARDLVPSVWVAQLRDINRWWREKAGFTVERIDEGGPVQLTMHCSERATVLVRHLDIPGPTQPWYGSYRVLEGRTLRVRPGVKPFIGLSPDAPSSVAAFLRDQGYIVETGPDAAGCAIHLTAADLETFQDRVRLIEFIETSSAPLVRYWRWPEKARSALCVTGDLDALSLMDYVARVFAL